MDGRMDGRTDQQTDGPTDLQTNGLTDRRTIRPTRPLIGMLSRMEKLLSLTQYTMFKNSLNLRQIMLWRADESKTIA